MSAACHLLRRRSSLLLQHRHKIHSLSIPSLVTRVQSNNSLSASFAGSQKFTTAATSKPPDSSNSDSSSSSGNKALKLTIAGTAILLLSAAAWYTARDDFPQLQHFGLPQLFHGGSQEEKKPIKIHEKSPNLVQSNEFEEEGIKKDALPETGQVTSGDHELTDVGQLLSETIDYDFSHGFVESGEGHLEESSPEPPLDSEEVLDVNEHESTWQQTLQDASTSGKPVEDNSLSKEAQEQQVLSSREIEQDDQSPLEALAGVVNEKISVVQDYLFTKVSDVDKGDELKDTRDEIKITREKLKQEYPEMFYADNDAHNGHNTLDGGEEVEKESTSEILESGSREYIGAHGVPSSLSVPYLVQRGHEDSLRRYLEKEKGEEVSNFVVTGEKIKGVLSSEEMKVAAEKSKVVGVDVLVGAVHTAEQLQAEVDSRMFKEQLQKIQEAHRHELNDFQAKIIAYAEDTDQLEKELKKEKEETALTLKLQEQRAEERLQSELRHKEEEAKKEKETLQLLGKAQTAASVTREKAEHLKDIHSVQLQVDALRTAFYTRSEEARISHTAHKLAMGAFALEEAIEKGVPVEKEAELLVASAGGPGVDPLVDAVVSSLPSEVLTAGTRTRPQLHLKFTRLKSSLRELALMPSGGGGVFAHFFARLTANLKVSEQGSDHVGSEGIEVVIGKVERLLAEENLVEAATVLEAGVRGTAAEGLAVEWSRQAQNRAIIEQGIQVLRAHVVAVASGLS